MGPRSILILGGTGEARDLAERLAARPGLAVTLSLAGRTRDPAPQAGRLRIGGFGGAAGLAQTLATAPFDILIDATHPFAERISAHAQYAAETTGVPLLALCRPPWPARPGDRWTRVARLADAPAALGTESRRVFLTIGRQEVHLFRAAPQHVYLLRSIDPPEPDALPGADTILGRGPFSEIGERSLLAHHSIEVIVAKNSGGDATYGKIAAARALGLEVVLVDRPARPETAASVDALIARLDHLLAAPAAERGV